MRHLHRRRADAARGGQHQHRLARLQPGPMVQREPRRAVRDVSTHGRRCAEIVRNRMGQTRCHQGFLGESTSGFHCRPNHPGAGRDGSVRASGDHSACGVHAGRERGRALDLVAAAALQDVREIEVRCFDADA